MPKEATKEDFFVSLTLKLGPKFFEGKKHATSREIADVFTHYANDPHPVLREMFTLLGKFYQAVEAVPVGAGDATGGYPSTVTWGDCGSCLLPNGQPGRTYAVTTNGETFPPDCYPCSPSGNPAG
jgi:hypothetical protein